jgi:hypothetical protein
MSLLGGKSADNTDVGVSAEGILEQVSQLRVSIRHVRPSMSAHLETQCRKDPPLLVGEFVDDFAEGEQTA